MKDGNGHMWIRCTVSRHRTVCGQGSGPSFCRRAGDVSGMTRGPYLPPVSRRRGEDGGRNGDVGEGCDDDGVFSRTLVWVWTCDVSGLVLFRTIKSMVNSYNIK